MIINNVDIVLPDKEIDGGSIVLKDSLIASVNDTPRSEPGEVFDGTGLIAVPGLIDLHIHGAMGVSIQDDDPDSLKKLSSHLPRFGITGFLWTTMAAPVEEIDRIMQISGSFTNSGGAECLGINIEGSFISPQRRGSHDPKFIFEPDTALVERWQSISGNKIKIITIAPERTSDEFIECLLKNNIIPSIGHSRANYEQTRKTLEKGASFFTHLGNATGMIHQREPGLVGAALLDDNSSIEIICDGVHLHSAIVQIFIKVKGWDKVVIVSDGTCVMGLEAGTYKWYDKNVEFDGTSLQLDDGTIAGGTLPLNKAMKNLMEFTGCTLSAAVRMTSLRPARVIGIDELYGSITPGKIADIVLLDKEYNVKHTFINGKLVYSQK